MAQGDETSEIVSVELEKMNAKDIEFDGNTVLCRVCGDRASGFHYGVHACEGCKGFFRRSIQQKIHYRPCLKNQLCLITRVNRNRCQYCRLKKCIAVGMSRDAVRFGRVPKREKAKIIEQMQRVNVQCQGSMIDSLLNDESRLCSQIIDVHLRTCMFTCERFRAFFERSWADPVFVSCSPNVACPLNPLPELSGNVLDATSLAPLDRWNYFSDCFTAAIRCVVDFCRAIPGFHLLSHEDQVTLLKAGTFEVMLVHLACLFDTKSNTMLFTNGKIFQRTTFSPNLPAGFLLNSMFDFAERFNELNVTDAEMALFSALIIMSSDRPGLRGVEVVEKLSGVIRRNLQSIMQSSRPDETSAFTELVNKIPDLRTLNTIHSEKLLAHSITDAASGTSTSANDLHSVYPSGSLKEEMDGWKVKVKQETTDDDAGGQQLNLNHALDECTSGTGGDSNEFRESSGEQCAAAWNASSSNTRPGPVGVSKRSADNGTILGRDSATLAGKPVFGTQFGGAFQRVVLKRKPTVSHETTRSLSATTGRRKSFSGWLSHRRPSTKQQVQRNDVIRKTSASEKNQISDAEKQSTTTMSGTPPCADNSTMETGINGLHCQYVARSDIDEIQLRSSDIKQPITDMASSKWCGPENPRQRYVHEMVFREQQQREKFQKCLASSDDCFENKSVGTSRSPFPRSTGSPMPTNCAAFPSLDECRQRMRLDVVDREPSPTHGTPRPPSYSSDLASSDVQSFRGVADWHGYSWAIKDHLAAMQYSRQPSMFSDAATARMAATSMYSQLVLRQHLEILRHRQQQLIIESASGQYPLMVVPDSTTMLNWNVPSLLADAHKMNVEADRFLLHARQDASRQMSSPAPNLKPSFG